MDNQEIQKFIGDESLTVSEAMQKIDGNQLGILFLVSSEEKLVGCITDGDIRRFLLSGGKMTGDAIEAANKTPRIAQSIDEARRLYHERK